MILEDYVNHIKGMNNQSMLARIYGIFKVKTSFYATIDVLIMQNISNLFETSKKMYSFDLKGSAVDRYVKFNPKKVKEYALAQKAK